MSSLDTFLASFDAPPAAAPESLEAGGVGEEADLDTGDDGELNDTDVQDVPETNPGKTPGQDNPGDVPTGEPAEPEDLPAENTRIELPPLVEGGEARSATIDDIVAYERSMHGFVESLRANPIDTLLKYELVNVEQLDAEIERRAIEAMKLRIMSDEERASYKEQQELAAWRKQKAAEQERTQKERQQAIVSAKQAEIRARIENVAKTANLAGTPGVKTVAVQVLLAAAEAGRTLTDDELARATRAKVERTVKALTEAGDAKAVAALLGPKIARKLAAETHKARPAKGVSVRATAAQKAKSAPKAPPRFRNVQDFINSL